MTRLHAALASILFVAALAVPAHAHDQWLEADPAIAAEARPVKLYLLVGEHFTEAQPKTVRRRERWARLDQISPRGTTDLRARVNEDQALLLALAPSPGNSMVVADSLPTAIELPARKFEEYLLEERLIDVLSLRVARGTEEDKGRELYSRCLKTLVSQPGAPSTLVTRPVGQPLEIVPAVDPANVKPGAEVEFQVLFEGKPLAGRAVTLANRHHGDVTAITRRTDAEGRVRFTLARPGECMVRLVHMMPATVKEADWRSYWASLTFSLPEP